MRAFTKSFTDYPIARWNELLDAATDLIFAIDLNGRFIFANRAVEDRLGWSSDQILGQTVQETFSNPEFKEMYRQIEEGLKNSSTWTGDICYISQSKKEVLVASTWSVAVDGNGQPAYYVHSGQVVTELRKKEEQLLRLQRLDTLGSLAGGVIHDLNNVLCNMTLTLEQVADRGLALQPNELAAMQKGVQLSTSLLRNLLKFVKGKDTRREKLLPNQILKELVDFTNSTFPEGVRVLVDCAPDTPAVIADPVQVQQILFNLCINARDALENKGQIAVRAYPQTLHTDQLGAIETIPANDYVCFEVCDNGKGMTTDVLAKVFDAFFTTKTGGSGLGLSTCLSILHDHGGYIDVESRPDLGSTFRVFLKAAAVQ